MTLLSETCSRGPAPVKGRDRVAVPSPTLTVQLVAHLYSLVSYVAPFTFVVW